MNQSAYKQTRANWLNTDHMHQPNKMVWKFTVFSILQIKYIIE